MEPRAFALADLCDERGDAVAVVVAGGPDGADLRDFGGAPSFSGPVVTLRVFEDNSLVREALGGPGGGAVLVVDGGGSRRCALLGDKLGALAVQNGWAGIVVNGCVRDSVALRALPLGVRALGTNPRRSEKKGAGTRGEAVRFGGVTFEPGARLYADEDGVVVVAAS